LRLPDEFVGQQVKCPTCQATFQADSAPPAPPLLPSSEPYPPEEELKLPHPEEPAGPQEAKPRRRRTFEDYDEGEDDDYAYRRAQRRQNALARIKPPAICMLVVASLALLIDIVNAVLPLVMKPPALAAQPGNPFAEFQRGAFSPFAAAMAAVFAVVAVVVLVGCIAMLQGRAYWLAMTVSILSMLHLGNCCCLLFIPFSIWSLVVLSQSDVRDAFH
jgi:hypothetical protein